MGHCSITYRSHRIHREVQRTPLWETCRAALIGAAAVFPDGICVNVPTIRRYFRFRLLESFAAEITWPNQLSCGTRRV